MLGKLNKIKTWQASFVITVIGFVVYGVGLKNPFQGDDLPQIVNNVPVHSIAHIKLFFEGGTFYTGNGLAPLSGVYFRPLMTTIFSLLYTLFGLHSLYFHVLQLLLCIGSAILLYLFFRCSFKALLSLVLALTFLIHPINSQVVYAISDMQDALFFFFGILALYILFRYKSRKSLLLVASALFLALLSKETAIFFVALAILYLFWSSRKRLYSFLMIMVVPIALWLVLKIHAVGLIGSNPHDGPIDTLSLTSRLLTAPSIMQFYITKLVFPWKLASAYYWTYRSFSVTHVLIPLVFDLVVIGIVGYVAVMIKRKASLPKYRAFLFFTAWATLGILATLQIIPLDFTAFEPWFYFPIAGVLGMIGVVASIYGRYVFQRVDRRAIYSVVLVLVLLLGLRTAVRGTDYRSAYILASNDIRASSQDYGAYNTLSYTLLNQGKFKQAAYDARRSISIFPTFDNYINLGSSLTDLGDYNGAIKAYDESLTYSQYYVTYEDLAVVALLQKNSLNNQDYFINTLERYPQDSKLWMYFAIYEQKGGDNLIARIALRKASELGQVPQNIYNGIANNQPFTVSISGQSETIQ